MNDLDNQPSIKKLKNDVTELGMLNPFLTKKRKNQLKDLKSGIIQQPQLIAKYILHFSDLAWCAYDSLNMQMVETAVQAFEQDGIVAAEEIIIKFYTTDVKSIIQWLKGKSEEFELRYTLILKAFDDHFAGRYHASVPLFLTIMDGAVNDFTGSKGFTSDGTNVDVWDCLVGVSDGLDKVRQIICAPRKKTNLEAIEIPYRHGILHGRDLNYDNVKVSCKCIALMFAIADWIDMKNNETQRKEKFEKDNNPPPLLESLKKLWETKIRSKEISNWKKRVVVVGQTVPKCGLANDYVGYEYLQKLVELFDYWKSKNYGYLAKCFDELFFWDTETKKHPAECRERFSKKVLSNWEFVEVEERGCGLTRVIATVTYALDGNEKTVTNDIILHYNNLDENALPLPWRNDGNWMITVINLL